MLNTIIFIDYTINLLGALLGFLALLPVAAVLLEILTAVRVLLTIVFLFVADVALFSTLLIGFCIVDSFTTAVGFAIITAFSDASLI